MGIDDRRTNPRRVVYIPARIAFPDGGERAAMTRDLSRTGLMVLTRAALEPGQTAELRLYVPLVQDELIDLPGRVVRKEPLTEDEVGTWREKVAFQFDEDHPELLAMVEALAEAQNRVYGR